MRNLAELLSVGNADLEGLRQLAQADLERRNLTGARDLAELLTLLAPASSEAWELYSEIYSRLGDENRASVGTRVAAHLQGEKR